MYIYRKITMKINNTIVIEHCTVEGECIIKNRNLQKLHVHKNSIPFSVSQVHIDLDFMQDLREITLDGYAGIVPKMYIDSTLSTTRLVKFNDCEAHHLVELKRVQSHIEENIKTLQRYRKCAAV